MERLIVSRTRGSPRPVSSTTRPGVRPGRPADSRSTPRESLPIPIGVTGGTGVRRRAAPERELDVAGEAAAREAPAVADAIPRHAPLHGALQARQRLGRQGIDAFGDGALRLRQAADVGKDRLVADRGLRGACPASHGGRQRRGGRLVGVLDRPAGRPLAVFRCQATSSLPPRRRRYWQMKPPPGDRHRRLNRMPIDDSSARRLSDEPGSGVTGFPCLPSAD